MPSSGSDALTAFLSPDPRDVGCARTWELIDVYVEAVVRGEDPESAMPGVTAHLASCPPCAGDYEGLRNALMTADRVVATRREPHSR